jgi:hypothetical protein
MQIQKTSLTLSVSGIWTCILPTNRTPWPALMTPHFTPRPTCTCTLHFSDTRDNHPKDNLQWKKQFINPHWISRHQVL